MRMKIPPIILLIIGPTQMLFNIFWAESRSGKGESGDEDEVGGGCESENEDKDESESESEACGGMGIDEGG